MNKTILSLLFILASTSLTAGQDPASITFRSDVKDLIVKPERIVERLEPEDSVSITLEGTMFNPPKNLTPTEKAKSSRKTVVSTISADFSAWKSNDEEWIKSNFDPKEHADLTDFLSDKEMREWNDKQFQAMHDMQIHGIVKFEDYRLIMVRYNRDPKHGVVLTVKKTTDGWVRTNALANTELYILIASAFLNGEVTPEALMQNSKNK